MKKYYKEDLAFIHSADVARGLRRAGFRVRTMRGYGKYLFPNAHAAFVAQKPV